MRTPLPHTYSEYAKRFGIGGPCTTFMGGGGERCFGRVEAVVSALWGRKQINRSIHGSRKKAVGCVVRGENLVDGIQR